jgi:hypothetical protein
VNPVPKLEEEEERSNSRSCISWQLVSVPDGLGEERITEGLTARSFLINANLDILVAVYIN